MKLIYDKWDHSCDVGGSIEITLNEGAKVRSYLERLDQREYTQFILETDRNWLLIGGGKGQFVCSFVEGEHVESYSLLQSGCDDLEEVMVVTGGQFGLFPRQLIVDQCAIEEVIEHYLACQEMSPRLLWKKD